MGRDLDPLAMVENVPVVFGEIVNGRIRSGCCPNAAFMQRFLYERVHWGQTLSENYHFQAPWDLFFGVRIPRCFFHV